MYIYMCVCVCVCVGGGVLSSKRKTHLYTVYYNMNIQPNSVGHAFKIIF